MSSSAWCACSRRTAADPVLTANTVQLRHELEGVDRLAIQGDRDAVPEADLDISRNVGALARIARPCVHVARWLRPWIFENARFDRTAPQVLVRRVGRTNSGRDLDPMLGRVFDLIVAIHAPLADWRDDLQLRGKRSGRDVETDLVVALACASMRDRR